MFDQAKLKMTGQKGRRVRCGSKGFSFGFIPIDDFTYESDINIDRGQIRKRNKKPSKKFRDEFGHIVLSIKEEISLEMPPCRGWHGRSHRLPVMAKVKLEAARRRIELFALPTEEAVTALRQGMDETNAILHVTC
jgi:hypothetical protein